MSLSVEQAAAEVFHLLLELNDSPAHDPADLRERATKALTDFAGAVLRAEAERIMKMPEITCPVTASALKGEYWYKSAFKDIADLLMEAADDYSPWGSK